MSRRYSITQKQAWTIELALKCHIRQLENNLKLYEEEKQKSEIWERMRMEDTWRKIEAEQILKEIEGYNWDKNPEKK